MATIEGKTPEQLAKEIVSAATTSVAMELNGVRVQELDKIVRYKHAQDIFSRGETYYNKMRDQWRVEILENFVAGTFKQQEKVIVAKEQKSKLDFYNLLVARGVPKDKAMEQSGL